MNCVCEQCHAQCAVVNGIVIVLYKLSQSISLYAYTHHTVCANVFGAFK